MDNKERGKPSRRRILFAALTVLVAVLLVALAYTEESWRREGGMMELAALTGETVTPDNARSMHAQLQESAEAGELSAPAHEAWKRLPLLAWIPAASGVGYVLLCAFALLSLTGGEPRRSRKRFDARRTALCGMLLSLMLVLGWVESLIPINAGIPGIKLGLSNGVLIFAVYMLDVPTSFVLMAMKVVLSSAFLGTPASMMLYGFAGGTLSLLGMTGLSRVKGMEVVVVSMMGGVLHNAGQVALAMVILNTPGLMYYLAVLMVVGLICGALTGVCAKTVMKHLKHVRL